jgi:hypothetical protein
MMEDWTIDIPMKTPPHREASKEEVITSGLVFGKPALLIANRTRLRLKVSGFKSEGEAHGASAKLCFGVRWMGLQVPIALQFSNTPQKVVKVAPDFKLNLSIDSDKKIDCLMVDGSPAIYRTGDKVLMASGGEVNFVISGLGDFQKALQWINEGAERFNESSESDEKVDTALELFNLAGFEPSSKADFLVLCTALEQLFPQENVDAFTLAKLDEIAEALVSQSQNASPSEKSALDRLRDRILDLKSEAISKAVRDGVAKTLGAGSSAEAQTLAEEVKQIYKVRNALAHKGRADLGSAPHRLKELLVQVLMRRL